MPIELTEEYVKNNAVPLDEAQPELTEEYIRANCVTEQEFRGGAPVFGRPQLRQSFLGSDPLAFETDPEQRKRLEETIALSANPEQSRKRAALAAYFSHGNRDETGFAYENIHSFIRMYHGREMSIDASFADIASMLSELPETTPAAPQKEPEQQEQPGGVLSYLSGVGGAALWGWARYWNNTGLGLVDTALTAGDVLDRGIGSTSGATGKGLSDVWIEHQSEKLGIEGKTETERKNYRANQMAFFRDAYLNAIRGELALVPEENQAKRQLLERKLAAVQSIYDARIRENNEAPSFQESYRQFQQEINRNLEQKLEEAQKKYHTGKTLGENWEAGDVGGLLAESVAVVTDQVALSVIPQTVSFALGGTALSMGALVSSSMGDRINQVSELGWSPERVTASAMYYAAAEAIPEFFLGKIPILKRIFGDGTPKGEIVRGLWRNTANLGREMLSAGARDTAGELVTFIAEKFQDGVEGVNTPGGKLLWEMSADEVREFALEGLAETIVGSMGTAGPMGGVAAFREQRTLRAIDAEKHHALNRAEARRNELFAKEELTPEEQAEAVALDLVLDAANEEAAAQVVNQVDAARQEAAAPENREKIGSPIPEEELSLEEQAEAAANSLELYKTLRHNPLDTVARLREVMRLYRFDNVEIVDRPESFSQAALDAIARHGFSPSMVRGFYDSASDTVYFNAARLSPSEVPGVVFHELVAHKGLREVLAPDAFHSMLDSVSSRHGGEARFREIAERYHLDLGTENGRREAAEEYIAHLAEERNEALKPSWWREFLAQVKQLLRRLPYLDRVRWSDREIEALLRRSARAMRRRNRAGSNRDAGMFFAVNENGETLFHITGRDNAMTAQEIIDDPTISPKDFVLTSEGSEIWGEITPEMVEKAGEKSGIKALPIKLKKGVHFSAHSGFGLVHLYTEHGKELEGKHYDLSALLTRIFGKPYQVYVSLYSGNVRLELSTRNRPREIGVLELQEENGFYSVITAFTRELDHYKLRGKEVWRYTGSTPNKTSQEGSSVISASKQRTGPLEPHSAENTADTARATRPKPVSNINDSQEKSSPSDDSFHYSIAADSAAFQRWFADSKVVDADGKPLVVYHGTDSYKEFFTFKIGKKGNVGPGIYLAADKNLAQRYADKSGIGDGRVYELYAKIEKPLRVTNLAEPGKEILKAVYGERKGESLFAKRSSSDVFGQNIIRKNDIEKLKELGYDGIIWGNSKYNTEYIVFSPTQIKSATENVGTFDPENPDIRFSESGQAEELANLMAKRVAPIIRDANGRDSDVREEVRTLLSQAGFDLSDAELEEIIKRAQQQVRRFRSLQRITEENDYIRATDPWIATLQDVYSTNFKISTAGKYATEDFSGTWIGKDGGVAPDEAARTLSSAFGQEITDDDVVDHFRYLKRRDILARRREENKAMEEALREEERLHDMELAEQILAGEFPFDDEFIGSNPRVAKMVRDMVSPAKPGEPRADWATVRAALGQENPQEFAKGYFEGREAGRQEYRERLREARKNTTDIRTLQEIATREVRRVLPEELQGAFLKRIAELGKFRTEPSPAYPQGRRAYELDKLIRDINSYEIRSRIIALADRYTAKRNYKGIPVSILENMQRELDEIRTVLRLSPEAVALKIAENSAAIEAQEAADASAEEIQKLQHENMVLSTFGNLDRKSPQELEQAMGALELVISTGKLRFATKLAQRQEQVAAMRLEALDDAGNQGKKARTLSGGIVTKQAGLRTLLDWVSLKSGKSFDESFSGKMMRRVEDATEEEKTRLRNMQKSFDWLLEQVGVKTLREKMEFFRELMRKEEKTGVHRLVYTSSRKFVNGEERLVNRRKAKRRLITPELARKLLADHDSGRAPMAYYTAEFLRLQLAAHDAGVKAEVNIMGTQEENDQIARYKLEAEGGKTLQLIEPTEEEFSHREELSLTRDAAMQIWLSWQQPDVRAGMEWNGWSESSIRELEKFLGERYLTLAKGLRSLIAAGRQELNARVEEFYGAGLPEKPNYFPAKHLESQGKEINSDTLLGSEYGQMSVSPGFLIARKFHLLDVDSDGTAIGSFLSNQMQAAHFLAFGRVIRDARAVYNDRDVRERITAEYGRDVFEQLIDRFDVIAKGGRKLTDAAHVLNSLYKVWVPAMIAVNASSAAKQIAGVVNYMNDIPAGAFFRGFADANIKSELFRRFIADNQVQEYIANRMEGGFDRDLSFLLNSTRNIENYNPLASAIIEYGTMPTRLADKWCTVRGGFAVFQYHYNEVLKRTGNEREAWDTAVRMWRRSTDETQQSGSLKDQNVYQSMGGLMRYLTVFMSAPIQMMNREFMAVNRMLAGTGERRAEARRELARVVLINHLVCPFLMEALTQFFRAGFDWDEYEFGSFLTGFLLGPFEGFVVFGKLIRALGDRLTGTGGWKESFQALPMADSAIQSVSTLMKIAQFDEFDSDDWVRQIKAAADLTMTAGSLVPGGGLAAAVGGAVSSTVRELRRIFRIVESAE